MIRGIVPSLLAAATGFAAELPPQWPATWRQGYERFEQFLEIRAKRWLQSDLKISPEGVVESGIFFEPTQNSHQSLRLFQDGLPSAASGFDNRKQRPLPIFDWVLPHRLNAAVIEVAGHFNYQYVPPLVWFEVIPAPNEERTLFGGRVKFEGAGVGKRTLKILPSPTPAEVWWPNERMLAWLDDQNLKGHHRTEIRKANRRITPAVFLQVDETGTIWRELLSETNAEAPLHWRVFRNGKLVHAASATGVRNFPTSPYGVGNYIGLAGIEGSGGFFPVSNLLQYTLAPGKDGSLRLLYSKFDYGRSQDYPEWHRAILPPPRGFGPSYFDNESELKAARDLAAAWAGCADLFNAPESPWIRREGAPDLTRPKGETAR